MPKPAHTPDPPETEQPELEVQYHQSMIRKSWSIDQPGLFVRLTLEGGEVRLEPSGSLSTREALALRAILNAFAQSPS